MTRDLRPFAAALALLALPAAAQVQPSSPPRVEVLRTPNAGIQPRAAFGADGTLHLLYFSGDPAAGDLYYVRRAGAAWSDPLRVNSLAGAAVAVGNIRGGKLALGPDNTIHVLWNGSRLAADNTDTESARPPESPVLYARLAPDADAFTDQRDLMTCSGVLDGGGDIAADAQGRVLAAWHALPTDAAERTESARRVFVAISDDSGRTFAPEQAWSDAGNGACACCALAAGADADGRPLILYRAARDGVHRGMRLLREPDGPQARELPLDEWRLESCPMSLPSIAAAPGGAALAWESEQGVRWALSTAAAEHPTIHLAAGKSSKHPAIAVDAESRVLVAWTEGMTWAQPGRVRWALWTADAEPLEQSTAADATAPPWSLVTAAARPGGGFVVIY